MGDLALTFKDAFVALIVVVSLISWARGEQRRMDKRDAVDEYLARTTAGRDA